MTDAVSPRMQEVVDRLRASGRPLVRLPGGYWTDDPDATGRFGAPAWYVGTQTVRALERRGLLMTGDKWWIRHLSE